MDLINLKNLKEFYNKISIGDKIKILLSFLFVIYSWYYVFTFPNPQSLDELKVCVGKVEKLEILTMLTGKGGSDHKFYQFEVVCNNEKMEFSPETVNPFYGDLDKYRYKDLEVKGSETGKLLDNLQLLKNREVKIWYIVENNLLFLPARDSKGAKIRTNRAYQIKILDFDYDKNPNLKAGEYFTKFIKSETKFNTRFALILSFSHIFFIILTIKILLKTRRSK